MIVSPYMFYKHETPAHADCSEGQLRRRRDYHLI
jgi:hypothetical protein